MKRLLCYLGAALMAVAALSACDYLAKLDK